MSVTPADSSLLPLDCFPFINISTYHLFPYLNAPLVIKKYGCDHFVFLTVYESIIRRSHTTALFYESKCRACVCIQMIISLIKEALLWCQGHKDQKQKYLIPAKCFCIQHNYLYKVHSDKALNQCPLTFTPSTVKYIFFCTSSDFCMWRLHGKVF